MKEEKIFLRAIIQLLICLFLGLLVTSPAIYSIIERKRETKRMTDDFVAGREQRKKELEIQVSRDIRELEKKLQQK